MLTQLIEKVILKVATVEQIHAEFDSGEERILSECDKILSELQIPTETQIERKASIMKDLGFVNSETVKQAEKLSENSKQIQQKIDITAKQAETIKYFKNKYPFEKFITVDELERICNKYNLIHAPVSNYIKDIPEKNVLEMKNCKKLEHEDKNTILFIIDKVNNPKDFKRMLEILGKDPNKWELTNNDVIDSHKKYNRGNYQGSTVYTSWIFDGGSDNMVFVDLKDRHNLNFRIEKYHKVDKSGLFIAAPKSHFNLKGLDKKSKFGFFKVETFEVKDPVVFEYCKDNICRIITKWGTDDDKSYLDPVLQNEILN